MKKSYLFMLIVAFLIYGCSETTNLESNDVNQIDLIIDDAIISEVVDTLKQIHGNAYDFRIEKGVNQVASFWNSADGSAEDFGLFCKENFISDTLELFNVFMKLSENFEVLKGNFNKINVDLNRTLHLNIGEIYPIDLIFGAYDPSAHLTEDFFENKIAMIVTLNFPFYSLEEKEANGESWTRLEWAFARMGDTYTSRVPAELLQKKSESATNSDTYISEYNIYMGRLLDEEGNNLFPEDLKLITHWGLRDELKSNYSVEGGYEKQKLIYEVMKDIINQDIPEIVINTNEYQWNPYADVVYNGKEEVKYEKEPSTRYQHLLNNFNAMKDVDQYSSHYPTFIKRKFEKEMEIAQEDVEQLFIDLVSSPEVKKVAGLIKSELGRNLQPFDIWYNGFRAGNTLNENDLNKLTRDYYPNPEAFQKELPVILTKLGWAKERAENISSKISVDPSRGAGHAWGAEMKSDKAHLRTRISEDGMDYKGYNIAVHEFGHNVEQTITLQDVDYYMLRGVPNTAFTEALAFIFQKRDIELLGYNESNSNKEHLLALDNFWSCYEIMGVSLVDMNVWKWLYKNPDATAEELQLAVVDIAKEIWNKYYAEVFGVKDSPILAIYSHMIDAPLYLSAYPVGHLIDFQIEKYIANKEFSSEIERMYKNGRIIPQIWMKEAVGEKLSVKPLLYATGEAIIALGNE